MDRTEDIRVGPGMVDLAADSLGSVHVADKVLAAVDSPGFAVEWVLVGAEPQVFQVDPEQVVLDLVQSVQQLMSEEEPVVLHDNFPSAADWVVADEPG